MAYPLFYKGKKEKKRQIQKENLKITVSEATNLKSKI